MVHYHIHNSLPPVPILNQINPVHAYHPTCWRPISILSSPSMPGSYKWHPSLRFPDQNPVGTSPLLSPILATCPTHLILLYLIIRIIFGEEYRSLSSSLFSLPHSPVTSSIWGPNILLSTQFSNSLSLYSSLNVSNQVSHPYKTASKIIVLYILFFIFLDSKLEDQKFCTEW